MPIRSLRSIVATQTPITVARNVTVIEAARTMKQHNVGALLVVDGARLCSISPNATRCFGCWPKGATRRPPAWNR